MRRTLSAVILGFSLLGAACSTLPDNLAFSDPAVTLADEEFPELMAFLEEERGLDFLEPVLIRRGDVAAELAVEAEQLDLEESEGEPVDAQSTVYTLFGLLDAGASVEGEAADSRTEVAGAFYDPYNDEIFMPEGPVTESVRALLVHELTHALQDQHGLLVRKLQTEDAGLVHLALIEGDADRMRSAWISQLSESEQAALATEVQASSSQIEELSGFSTVRFLSLYALGQPAAEILLSLDGPEAFTEGLKDGGGSTERLLDPLTPTAQPKPAEVREAPASQAIVGEDLGEGTLGPLTLYLALVATDLSATDALQSVVGYDNDRYRVVDTNEGPCVVGSIWVDNVEESAELVAAFERVGWQASATTAGVPQDPAVHYEGCTPISPVRTQQLDLLTPVWVSNWAANRLIDGGVDPIRARCRALILASSIPVADVSFAQFDFETIDRLVAQPWVTEACPD